MQEGDIHAEVGSLLGQSNMASAVTASWTVSVRGGSGGVEEEEGEGFQQRDRYRIRCILYLYLDHSRNIFVGSRIQDYIDDG